MAGKANKLFKLEIIVPDRNVNAPGIVCIKPGMTEWLNRTSNKAVFKLKHFSFFPSFS